MAVASLAREIRWLWFGLLIGQFQTRSSRLCKTSFFCFNFDPQDRGYEPELVDYPRLLVVLGSGFQCSWVLGALLLAKMGNRLTGLYFLQGYRGAKR